MFAVTQAQQRLIKKQEQEKERLKRIAEAEEREKEELRKRVCVVDSRL